MLLLFAETIAVDGFVLGGASLTTIGGAIMGYATMRANVRRNTERIQKLEEEVRAKDAEIERLRRWRAFLEGQMDGKGGRSPSHSDSITRTWEHPKQR